MSETTRRVAPATDEATQQLRRVTPAMPRPLDPASSDPAGTSRTEVLSIHDLLDGPGGPPPAEPAAVQDAPALTPLPSPAAAPRPAPAAGSQLGRQMRSDAAAAWTSTRQEVRDWLGRGDNALIAATVAVAWLLLVVVALVS